MSNHLLRLFLKEAALVKNLTSSRTKFCLFWNDKPKSIVLCKIDAEHRRSLKASDLASLSESMRSILKGMEENLVNAAETGSRELFKRICVFCGSRSGNRTSFSEAALDLGKKLAERKIDLVYGGGSVGLMGLISKAVYDGGCHVLGVIPTALLPSEILGESIGEVKRVADMHERKSEMAKNADAFIALPGGYGTMEELLEIIAWSQLGIHHKPVGILNVDGYYNDLIQLFDKGVREGFIEDSASHIVISADNAEELLRKMEAKAGEERRREANKKRRSS
ncbi:hypothetical protein ZIOFF_004546 [Zingiber officinale]|uniref:Cytokinin riboside 5'-monophosphate phosphoribohydrolase n=2 Tax=Zingiber officinale TaxID=94328 RepID=A0A8J5M3S3_ZINOF|nr:hypothetical protein ZIOFF_004546 [Zingiber officinale]